MNDHMTNCLQECPDGMIRFQDHCFKFQKIARKFSQNLDDCHGQNMTLWNPESEEEHQFVRGIYSDQKPFHLGILMIDHQHGWIGSDNSLFISNSYYLAIKSEIPGVKHLSDKSCLLFNTKEDKYEFSSPCSLAFSLCKTELGN